jgi:hypothetical protein
MKEYIIGKDPTTGKLKVWMSWEDAMTREAIYPKIILSDDANSAKEEYVSQVSNELEYEE